MSERNSTSQNRLPAATGVNEKESIEIIGVTLAGAVTVVMADRSFSLLSALVGLIILIILRSEEFGKLGDRIYSALFALGLVIIFGYLLDMILLYVTQEFRWLSNGVGSTARFLDRIGFLPLRDDEIGEPDKFEPGPMWMNGYTTLFHILIIAVWYTLAGLICWQRCRKRMDGNWRCFVTWWKAPRAPA
jgi:hypothetical protein